MRYDTTLCLSSNTLNVQEGSAPPLRLLVATIEGVAIVERASVGERWRFVRMGLPDRHAAALCQDARTGTVFAGIHHGGGLWCSEDNGETWDLRIAGLTSPSVFSMAIAYHDDRTRLFAGCDPAHLFFSDDAGRSWEELPAMRDVPDVDDWDFPLPPHVPHVKSVAIDPRDPQVIYAGIERGALLKTVDGGKTWRELHGYARADDRELKDVHHCFLLPSDPDRIYMATGIGLYTSPDGGETWERLTDLNFRISYTDNVAVSPADGKTIFMCGAAGFPGSWRNSRHADGAVCRSSDGGRTWETLAGNGLPVNTRANYEAIGTATYPGGYTLFVGDTDGNVYSSEDSGDSFELIAQLPAISKELHYSLLRDPPLDRAMLLRKREPLAVAV